VHISPAVVLHGMTKLVELPSLQVEERPRVIVEIFEASIDAEMYDADRRSMFFAPNDLTLKLHDE